VKRDPRRTGVLKSLTDVFPGYAKLNASISADASYSTFFFIRNDL
jgi:hypothetical protein